MAVLVPAAFALPIAGPAECAWQTFTAADGLADNQVPALAEDREGNLWFGSFSRGVSRYDGVAWRTYDAQEAGVYVVRSILVDRAGVLWVATDATGVRRYDGETWSGFTTADGLADDFVRSILEDGAGNLWFGTLRSGVSRYDGTAWRTFSTADGLAGRSVRCMLEDRAGNLWFGTDSGVSRYDGTTWRSFRVTDGLPHPTANSMVEDRAGNLWVGTGGGVGRFDGATWRSFTTADGLAGDNVTAVLEDRAGRLWFGTDGGGVSRFDGATWRTFTTADGLASDRVLGILEDRVGNLWFATDRGVSRSDLVEWTAFTAADGLASDDLTAVLEDRAGNKWFGTYGSGVSRFDGATWQTFTTADGLAHDVIYCILEDDAGNLWFGTNHLGVSRFDGSTWRTFTTADGLAHDFVGRAMKDRAGNLWFATEGGASRFDGVSWHAFTIADGLASNRVYAILEDRAGDLWFGTDAGLSRFDGATWRTFTTADGLAGNGVTSLLEDRAGNLWAATDGGLSSFDGRTWSTVPYAAGIGLVATYAMLEDRTGKLWLATDAGIMQLRDADLHLAFTGFDELGGGFATSIIEARNGDLWFATFLGGARRYSPDHVPTRTVLLSTPPGVSPSRHQQVVFGAAHGETRGVEFSCRLDGAGWSVWSPSTSWLGADLGDGPHVLEVRSRDGLANVDPFGAVARFTIDATSPGPVIAAPAFMQAVRERVEIRGTASDLRFKDYRVEARPAGSSSWAPPEAIVLAQSVTPVVEGPLAAWDTTLLPDGSYDLRVSVTDTLGLTGTAQVTVVVDNHAPFADQTAPAKVAATTGGDVYTTHGDVHLYFPPHAFARDAVVAITPIPADSVPGTLPSGALQAGPGHRIAWDGAPLLKPARLSLSYSTADPAPAAGALAIHVSTDGAIWRRLGGTVVEESRRVELAVSEPGRYALFAGGATPEREGALSTLTFTPRVFSPAGGFADREVGIAFTLARAGAVTVRVYNRAGRVVREVAREEAMGAGAQLVRWDGRDREGAITADGLYLVTVTALGETRTRTLAVVR